MKQLFFTLILFTGVLTQTVHAQYGIESRLTGNPSYTYQASPSDWRDINMYQVFTDRFFDGDTGNNFTRTATTGAPWYNQSGSNAENDRHFFQGGDWSGIRQKLDYLQGMGVNCVWISGVQLNEQGFDKNFTPYHAYHPADFYQVEPMFGTFQELKDLIDDIHSRGMYVCIDVVVNHMADLLKYTDCNCNYSGYCESGCASQWWWNDFVTFGAPFNDPQWFHTNGTIGDNDWDTYPRYINGAFLGTEDLRTEDPFVQNELKNIFKHLIDSTDCDGFRVDAIKHMEYDFIKGWADDMRQHATFRGKNNFLLFGEYFSYDDGIQASYCKDPGFSFNSTLWFPMQSTMKSVFAYEQGTSQLASRMAALNQYGEAKDKVVAFMDNHDVDRIALEAGSQWEAKLKPALTFLYTATPVPCLFYGTEHGFNQGDRRNGPPAQGLADFQRETMWNFGFQWGNAFGDKFFASSFYNYIKQLNELRDQYECLRRGTYSDKWQDGGAGLFAYSRTLGDQDALVIFNTAWDTRNANPQVSKPNGTLYENKLNPGETITVVDGRLDISVNGKESKIFVAGLGTSQVTTSCDSDTLTVTYTPGGGVLANPVGTIHINLSHDGGQNPLVVAMTPSGSDWVYTYNLTNATNDVSFSFHDEDSPQTVDQLEGSDWLVDVEFCGQLNVDLQWIGATYHWPIVGEWDVGEDLWVNIESWPQEAVADGEVTYSTDGGTTWLSIPMTFNGINENNDTWHANLGTHPGGTTLRYAVRLTGRNGDLWDNNSGSDYTTTVNVGPSTITWVGNTTHWPENNFIEPGDDLWVNMESEPVGAGASGEVVFSSDGGATWQSAALVHNGTANDRDLWHANLGSFSAETVVRYGGKVVDGDGSTHWDNNGGVNYDAQVNASPSSIRWFGNTIHAGILPPVVDILPGTGNQPSLRFQSLEVAGHYRVMQSSDLHSWSNLNVVVASSSSEAMTLYGGSTEPDPRAFFCVEPSWIPSGPVFGDEEVTINVETWPIGGAMAANLVYTTDGGATWNLAPMSHSGTLANNDVWSVTLGSFPMGTLIQYAVEVLDDQGASQWDNNTGSDFTAMVQDPDQTDFEAPTTSYTPQNTTTADPTLDVTLSATDDLDPSPTLYYTTDGSLPTVGSAMYSSPIMVTDLGSGIDMTIKFFARDVSGNESGVTTVEVKVNETFTFGSNTPYSTNPTLGQSVPNGVITADGVNNGEWDDSKLIALDMANDDPRSLGSNWTLHEAPIDLTHLWAAWDDNNLYLAWQYVDVTDIIDGANAGGAGSGRINSNDGILQWIALDTKAGGAPIDVWGKNLGEPYWTGSDIPDVQIYMAGSLWQGFIARAVGGVFPVDDGGVDYFPAAAAGITYGTGNSFEDDVLWGVGDCDDRMNPANRNFISEGHDTTRDSFYEIAIPLSTIELTRSQLEANGLGVLMGAGSESCMDSIPHDETTVDTPGVEAWNSSFEWGDIDSFTTPFARVGAGK